MRPIFPPDASTWPAHPDGPPCTEAPPQQLPEVELRALREEDYPVLERWMAIPDVHGFLEVDEPPDRHAIKVAVLGRQIEPLIIASEGRAVGFFALYFRGLAAQRSREFDIAVPAHGERQQGLGKAAIRAFEHWAFEQQDLRGVWAKIFTDNRVCLELVRACGWPLSAVLEGAVDFRGEERDLVYTWMTPGMRGDAVKRRGF